MAILLSPFFYSFLRIRCIHAVVYCRQPPLLRAVSPVGEWLGMACYFVSFVCFCFV